MNKKQGWHGNVLSHFILKTALEQTLKNRRMIGEVFYVWNGNDTNTCDNRIIGNHFMAENHKNNNSMETDKNNFGMLIVSSRRDGKE